MGRRTWRSAALLAVGLACITLVAGRNASPIGTQHPSLQDAGRALVEGAALPDAQVGPLLAARRVDPERGKPLVLTLAALGTAVAVALAGSTRRRQLAVGARAARLVPVPCGVRAPPVRSV